jgi:hypothetical protein
MVEHKCEKCEKTFKQKIHLDNHKKRKTPCVKASVNRVIKTKPIKKLDTKPLSWYSENMPDIFNFISKDLHKKVLKGENNIIIPAQVKTGKRFIAQAYSAYTTPIVGESTAHVFVSSFIRVDDNKQRLMLNAYFQAGTNEQRVFKINTEKARLRCIKRLIEIVAKHDRVIVHLDELDYGSGSEQHMAAVYEYCINQEKIILISYSASYEEATIESFINISGPNKPVVVPFTPPAEYRGAKWFCDKGLIIDAKPFFDANEETITLSESAKEILKRAKERLSSDDPKVNCRKLMIVRVNTPFEATKNLIDTNTFPELERVQGDVRIFPKFIHSNKELNTTVVKWDDYNWWKNEIDIERSGKFLMILFIDQCSTRSTDWFCHPWLNVYHDYHGLETPMNTCIQSNLRPVYYTNKMCDGIKVYMDEEFFPEIHGQKEVVEYVAGLKSIGDISRPVSSRTKVFEKLKTYGPVMVVKFNNQEMEKLMPTLNGALNDTKRKILELAIRDKLRSSELKILEGRTLKGKRTFNKDTTGGGIYTVATKKLRNINSGPGGGIGEIGGDVYNNRGQYFWADFALEELEFTLEGKNIQIPKGSVYITYGIADPPVEDDDTSSDSEYAHRVGPLSMYH